MPGLVAPALESALGWCGRTILLPAQCHMPTACCSRSGKPEPWHLVLPESSSHPQAQEILVLPHAASSAPTHVPC